MKQQMKIVFFDIDGTLVDESTGFQIPQSALEAIRKLKEAGHLAVINTGRTASFMEPCILEAGFDGFIYGCGTMIEYHGETLLHRTLSQETLKHLVTCLRKYKIDGVLEGKNCCYFEKEEDIISPVFLKMSQSATYTKKDFDEEIIEADKLYVLTGNYSDYDSFYREFCEEFEIIDRGEGAYEMIPKGYSKATGMHVLVEYLKKQQEDGRKVPSMESTYAVGDSTNDLPMLLAAAKSIAMGNSMKEILPKVDFVTKRIEEDGIAYAIENFILQENK